jgi:hypothetical protein
MQDYDGYYFILALAKTPEKSGQAVTPAGVPGGAGTSRTAYH